MVRFLSVFMMEFLLSLGYANLATGAALEGDDQMGGFSRFVLAILVGLKQRAKPSPGPSLLEPLGLEEE